MAAGSGRTVCGATLTLVLLVSLSSALPASRRSGSEAGPDVIVNRDRLHSTTKKEMPDELSIRRLRDFVEQLSAKRTQADEAAGTYLGLKSRGPENRRAALEDEDPLHILLGSERPDWTRDHRDGRSRTRGDAGKRQVLVPAANKRSEIARVLRDQRSRLQKAASRPARQDFLYAIGAAQRPSYGGESSNSDRPYGSHGWENTDSEADREQEDSYEYYWVECDENDPECEELKQ